MEYDLDNIRNIVSEISFVEDIYFIEQLENELRGKVKISFGGLDKSLDFEFKIRPPYPLRTFNSESITFINKNLIAYNHVMRDGSICIHTSHNTKLKEKLIIDFNSLKDWIFKYYINKDKDANYEHIIVNESAIDDIHYSYIFTECDSKFYKDEYGTVELISLKQGYYYDSKINNYLIKSFIQSKSIIKNCKWNNKYLNKEKDAEGFYYFIEEPPANYNKFGFANLKELTKFISTDFLNLIHKIDKKYRRKNISIVIPLFLGYKINTTEIHWQAILFKLGSIPLQGKPVIKEGVKTGDWFSVFIDENITWGITHNASYKYFFGRGAFSEKLTEKKILIIGIGALGSMIAQTLTRCGCKFIEFADYDIKQPENVCRSEYKFNNGICDKTLELYGILSEISPFIECNKVNDYYFERNIKSLYNDKKFKTEVEDSLNHYDLIFDCTTDNDLMFVLDSLELKNDIINLSITNHANQMVGAFYPNIYKFVINQFTNVLKNDTQDMYEPTGCWSPTFKATYNDINVLVQLALKHLNSLLDNNKPKNNFVIDQIDGNYKIIEY